MVALIGIKDLRFCSFSAVLLKVVGGNDQVYSIGVLYACRDTLERKGPGAHQPKAHRLSLEQVWSLDVRIAAMEIT